MSCKQTKEHSIPFGKDECSKCGLTVNQILHADKRTYVVPELVITPAALEKTDLSLNPLVAEIAMAKAFEVGARKYGRSDYEKRGGSVSEHIAAIKRHIGKYMRGEDVDPDGQPHLGSVLARVAMLLRQAELGTLKDDRYKGEVK